MIGQRSCEEKGTEGLKKGMHRREEAKGLTQANRRLHRNGFPELQQNSYTCKDKATTRRWLAINGEQVNHGGCTISDLGPASSADYGPNAAR